MVFAVEKPTAAPWSTEPPFDGTELRLERVGTDLLRITGDDIEFELPVPALGACTKDPTQVHAPVALPDADVSEKPVWLALRGEQESASLRLSTRGALLVVDNGCIRAGDVTTALLGPVPEGGEPGSQEPNLDGGDPIFAGGSIAPDEAYDAYDLRLRRRTGSLARVMREKEPLIEVSYFDAEPLLDARTLEDKRWIHLELSREFEYKRHDGVSGRIYSLMWTLEGDGEPKLVFENDYIYGSDGSHRAETEVRATRVNELSTGALEVRAKRETKEGALTKVDRKRCPDAKDFVAFSTYEESVRWYFHATDAKRPKRLGIARLDAIFASTCVDHVDAKTAKERLHLAERAPKRAVKWKLDP